MAVVPSFLTRVHMYTCTCICSYTALILDIVNIIMYTYVPLDLLPPSVATQPCIGGGALQDLWQHTGYSWPA